MARRRRRVAVTAPATPAAMPISCTVGSASTAERDTATFSKVIL